MKSDCSRIGALGAEPPKKFLRPRPKILSEAPTFSNVSTTPIFSKSHEMYLFDIV